jgi:Predicted carboxypeptidase
MEVLTLGSTGLNVKLLQSFLRRIGYNPGPVDGVFGRQTQQAVINYQRDNGLIPDGIVGPATWARINSILRGYAAYIIRPGDTLYSIARRFYTTVNAIITANPGIRPEALFVGQNITVPYGIDVVFTDVELSYEIMERNIFALKGRYPFIEVGTAGKSILGKNLYYIRLGNGPNQVFYNGSHHGTEWITSLLLMKFIEDFSKAYSARGNIGSFNTNTIWNSSSIYIIPMVNPDGVDLVQGVIGPGNPYYQQAVSLNNTGRPLSQVWKANIRGVDLNVNYPAEWDRGKQYEISQGITGPAPQEYGGTAPLSEPESLAVYNFTLQHNFRLVIAFHSQGRVIYWQFEGLAPAESLGIARRFSAINGYTIELNPGEAAFAGYKDWFILQYRRPGFTIEVGVGPNNVPVTQFDTIYRENLGVLLLAAVI